MHNYTSEELKWDALQASLQIVTDIIQGFKSPIYIKIIIEKNRIYNIIICYNIIEKLMSGNDNVIAELELMKQKENPIDFIDFEIGRLNDKKKSIDSINTTQKRILQLNDSNRKRANYQTYILIVIVVGLVLILGTLLIKKYIFDNIIMDIIVLIITSLTIIYVLNLVGYMNARDPIDFDRLNLSSPGSKTEDATRIANSDAMKKGDLLGSLGLNSDVCVGQACCSDGTIWDSVNSKCIIKQAFTTLNDVKNNSSYEFNHYTPYK